MIKLVRIYPKEYWEQNDSLENEVYVNKKRFLSSLDSELETCQMQKYFGTVQVIEIVDDGQWKDRREYFFIENQVCEVNKSIYEWDMCAIQEELNKEDYPEYFL